MSTHLYRVQDREGRGPWRPGFSIEWLDEASDRPLPVPITNEVPDFHRIVRVAHEDGLHIGCAVRGRDGVFKWFLASELTRLKELGFRLVCCNRCKILAETPTQLLIGSRSPLARLPRVSWEAA